MGDEGEDGQTAQGLLRGVEADADKPGVHSGAARRSGEADKPSVQIKPDRRGAE